MNSDSLKSWSSISSESGSGSGYVSRVLITKNLRKKMQVNFFFFNIKNYKQKDVQATGEAFSHQKRTSSTLKDEIYQLFYIFLGHFCPLRSASGLRIQIQNTVFFKIQPQRYNFIYYIQHASPAVPQIPVLENTSLGLNPRTVTTFACTVGSQTLHPTTRLDLIN